MGGKMLSQTERYKNLKESAQQRKKYDKMSDLAKSDMNYNKGRRGKGPKPMNVSK